MARFSLLAFLSLFAAAQASMWKTSADFDGFIELASGKKGKKMRCGKCAKQFNEKGGCALLLKNRWVEAEELLPSKSCKRPKCQKAFEKTCQLSDAQVEEVKEMDVPMGDDHPCDDCMKSFNSDGGCDLIKQEPSAENQAKVLKMLPSPTCMRQECGPAAMKACDMPDPTDPTSGSGQGSGSGQPMILTELEKFSADYDVTINLDMVGSPIGFQGSVAFDGPGQYADFSFTFDKGVQQLEDTVQKMGNVSLDGVDGDETLSFAVRLVGGDTDLFSMNLKIADGMWPIPGLKQIWPDASNNICIEESMSNVMAAGSAAVGGMPEGLGVHAAIPHPNALGDDISNVGGTAMGSGPKIGDTVNDQMQVRGDVGAPEISLDEAALMDSLEDSVDDEVNAEQDAGMSVPHGGQPPFDVSIGMDPATNVPNSVVITLTEKPFTGTVQIDITNFKTGPDAAVRATTTVCDRSQSLEQFVGQFMPPSQQEQKLRRLENGPVKLFALESLTKVFKVMHKIAPATRKTLPEDATRLWNRDEMRAAKVEREVNNRFHVAFGGPVRAAIQPTLLVGACVLSALLAFAAGMAISKFQRQTPPTSSAETAMLQASE